MVNLFKVNGNFSTTKLLIAVLATLGVGFLSSFFTIKAAQIYRNLIQPSFAPPSWIFGPVWTVLYILMGLAAYRMWMYGKEDQEVRNGLTLYLLQLLFNFLWSLLFFTLHLRGLAFAEILVLWLLIVLTMLRFKKVDLIAFYLLVPYILWVSFASVLNYSVWILNR